MPMDPGPATRLRPRWRRSAAMLTVVLVIAATAACSSSSDDQDTSPDRSTTTTSVGSSTSSPGDTVTTAPDGDDPTPTTDRTSTTGANGAPEGGDTTIAPADPDAPPADPDAPPADPDAPPAKDYSGPFDGQDAGTTISFDRGADVSAVEVKGLVVMCEPIDNTGDSRTKTIDLSFPDVPVQKDGSVDVTLEDAKYQPSMSGSFTPDGSFAGSVFLSFEDDGYACGGDYPFIAKPS